MAYMKITDLFNQIKNNGGQMPQSTSPISNMYAAPPTPTPVIPTKYKLKNRGAEITDNDIEALRPLLFGEVSNRPMEKKTLEGDVIFNTLLNRQKEYANYGKNKSLSEIMAMPNQYQAYNGPQYKEYASTTNSLSAAKKKEIDAIVDAIKDKVKKGDYRDNTEGSYYYIHNPDGTITYDNKKQLFKK